jgi:hypothetical protein
MLTLADGGAIHTHGQRNIRITDNQIKRTGRDVDRGNDAVNVSASVIAPGRPATDQVKERMSLINDIYIDNVSAACFVNKNVGFQNGDFLAKHLILKYHPDMFDPTPKKEYDIVPTPPGQRQHLITEGQLQRAVVGFNHNSLLCPSAKEDPDTCGCGADTRHEAESLESTRTANTLAPQQISYVDANGSPVTYMKFNPDAKDRFIAFFIPNPEEASSGKSVWYNLKIKGIKDGQFGSFKIKLEGQNKVLSDDDHKTQDVIVDQTKFDSYRLTENRSLWKLNSDLGAKIEIRLITNSRKPISFDYFELYRSADPD